MPSESAKKRQAQKKERERQRQKQASARKNQQKAEHVNGASAVVDGREDGACAAGPGAVPPPTEDETVRVKSKPLDKKAVARSCTGRFLTNFNGLERIFAVVLQKLHRRVGVTPSVT